MTEMMEHISIFWTNDSDELVELAQALGGEPGLLIGNDGQELAVTEAEYEKIVEYAAEHPEIVIERHGRISREDAEEEHEFWRV